MKNIQLLFLTFLIPFLSFSQEKGLDQRIDEAFQPISDFFSNVVFFEMTKSYKKYVRKVRLVRDHGFFMRRLRI